MALRVKAEAPIRPNLFSSLFPRPRAKGSSTMPPRMRPRLKRGAEGPSTPRSLRAFPIQSNHGVMEMEMYMMVKVIKGAMIPHILVTLTQAIPIFFALQ
jgi:hypothetical protein